MNVIGIDLSLTASGLSDGTTTWVIRSAGHKGDNLTDRTERLLSLRTRLLDHIPTGALVVIEQPAYSRQTGHMHDRSGLWWLIVSALHLSGHHVVEVSPSALKKYATGKGSCAKSAIVDATARRFPDIDTGNGDDNRCDALWLAAMGIDRLGGLSVVPAAQRAALLSVGWPSEVAA